MMIKIKRKFNKYLPVLILVGVFGFLAYWLRFKNNVPKVPVTKPEYREITKTVSASGYTSVPENYIVKAKTSGTVKKLNFKSGDLVKAGDVVLEFDLMPLKANLDTAYANYLSAKAELDSYEQKVKAAKATLSIRQKERDEIWREYMGNKKDSIKKAYKTAEASYQTALSNLKDLEEAKAYVEKSVVAGLSNYNTALSSYQSGIVKSPADGFLALSNIQVGTYATSGQDLFYITNKENLIFKAEIDEADVSHVSVGMNAKINLDSYPGKVFTGKVESLDTKVITLPNGSNAVMADISFDTSEIMPVIRFNGSADIEIQKSERTLSLPPESVFEELGKTYVYAVVNEKIVKKEVQKGFEGDEYLGIVNGLDESDLVVADPTGLSLKEGQKVRI